jgi:hypothetical protein
MSEENLPEREVRVASECLTLEKRATRSETAYPVVEYRLEYHHETPGEVTLREALPASLRPTDVEFHPDFHADNWRCTDDEVAFEMLFLESDVVETKFGLSVDDAAAVEALLTPSEIVVDGLEDEGRIADLDVTDADLVRPKPTERMRPVTPDDVSEEIRDVILGGEDGDVADAVAAPAGDAPGDDPVAGADDGAAGDQDAVAVGPPDADAAESVEADDAGDEATIDWGTPDADGADESAAEVEPGANESAAEVEPGANESAAEGEPGSADDATDGDADADPEPVDDGIGEDLVAQAVDRVVAGEDADEADDAVLTGGTTDGGLDPDATPDDATPADAFDHDDEATIRFDDADDAEDVDDADDAADAADAEDASEAMDAPAAGADAADPPDEGTAATTDAESLASALAAELRAGTVPEDDLAVLRDALDREQESESDRVRLEHLQRQYHDLAAYTDALSTFIDENGSADDVLADLRERVADLEELEARLDDLADGFADEAAVDALEDDLHDLRHDVHDARTHLDDRIDDVEDRLDDLEATVDDLEEETEVLLELQDVFSK